MSPNRVASLFSRPAWAGLTIVASLAMTACSTTSNTAVPSPSSSEAAPAAGPGKGVQSIARLEATKGSQVTGTVQFFPQADGSVRVKGRVEGLAPNTEHGFHVHEKGDCSSGDGLSAGGHFNPGQQAHGKFNDSKAHHIGDLPSLDADTQGVAVVDFVSKELKLDRGSNGVLGRSLIVHNDPDDYTTQPTGNSGARLACAVIERGA
ncbi:MAG: superoxide dismutase family protein [Comamonas sp.]|jgi:Cu-Zn family superoxide dismutase|uniref:superoxide dismutase family protein n=1 Tax=Comamonas sp. TaxID=34028 RepID=UPI00284ECB5D|nr:superoxide dismutase family protein [Comamonas sp.]MDR3064973.1 superoxide dismutase family protein [Comamonas sp.]